MFYDEITQLIATHREDDWWDFKREHHNDKAELVHDILCMANNRARRDSYIILGVENNERRRNQQNIVDILRNISFAGGVRPRIEVQTITIDSHEIDVLIIKDSFETPFYLEKEYRDKLVKNEKSELYGKIVRPYHIYTRVVGKNTAVH